MAPEKWREAGKSEDVTEGSYTSFQISEDENVLVTRHSGKLHAWADYCPHVGCPLSWGHIDGNVIICACHNARFDLTSGNMITAPSLDDLTAYEVSEENGRIYIGAARPPSFPEVRGDTEHTVAIVGAGAGGSAAAEQLRREGFSGRIVLISAEASVPYDRTVLSKFFLKEDMSVDDIALRPAGFYQDAGIELWTKRSVTRVMPKEKRIELADGGDLHADSIILATGSRAKTLAIPGVELEGCFTIRSIEDALAVRSAARESKKAVVIGASFIGTETAAYLCGLGLQVRIVAPESVPFERILGERVGKRFASLHTSQGVELRLGEKPSRFLGNGRVERVRLESGEELEADLVIVGVGAVPNTEYLAETELLEDGAVDVNIFLETKADGVYAIGDIARIRYDGELQRVEHWVEAQRHGQEAARTIVGRGKGLQYEPFFWTMQFETPLAYIGYAPEYEEIRYTGDVENGSFLAGYFRGGTLAAVASIGKSDEVIRYGNLLEEGRRISPEEFEEGL